MLGTNDFQSTHDNDAWLSAQGTAKLVTIIRQSPIEPGMPVPQILIVAPPRITHPRGAIAHKFKNAEQRCVGLSEELERVAKETAAMFFDAGVVTEASAVDGIHLDEPQHQALGAAIARAILDEGIF